MKTLIIIIITVLLSTCALADSQKDERVGRVVLVIAGGISVRDIADPSLRSLWNMMESGSGALVNARTGRPSKDVDPVDRLGMEPGCVSLGAGAMAVAGAEARRAAGVDGLINGIPAGATYKCRTALDIGSAEVVHPEISRMQRANEAASYRARPGALGSALHRSGIKTAVIGNSDIPGEMHREAVAAAMDETGLVDYGDVDSPDLMLSDTSSAYGVRTNQAALLREFDRVAGKSRFIVIDFGDTFRADAYAESCTDEQAAIVRRRAVRRLDAFLTRLATRLDFNRDTLLILSPNSRMFSEIEDERLAPVIVRGPEFGSGTLTSASTRRTGVATISDIAPTVMSLLHAQPESPVDGRPIEHVAQRGTAQELLRLNTDASGQGQRQSAMRGGSVVQSVVVALVTVVVMLGIPGRWRGIAAWLSLVPLALPFAMLYLPLIYSGGLVGAVLWLIGLTVSILLICSAVFRSPTRAFVWLCAGIVITLMIDLLRSAPLISSSIAGYSIIEGARYYGIGNELMGTMLAAAILGTGVAFSSWKAQAWVKWIVAGIVYASVLAFIGAPNLGVNLGGALAAAPALGAALLARRGKWPNWRSLLVAALLVAVAIGAMVGVDVIRGGTSQSHVGRALGSLAGGNRGDLLLVAERKIALNFTLVSTSVWSRLLALSLAGSGILLWRSKRKRGGLLSGEESAAAIGTIIGVIGAFAFNDSGVVAAAACAVVLWVLLAVRSLTYINGKGPGG
ncbi:MAG: hypothetical protein ACYC64_14850 [Armatimonadota bacterium]